MTERIPAEAWLLAALAGRLPALEPEAAVRERLRANLLARVGTASMQRRDEGEWRALLPGIEVKTLRRDERSETTLWRLAPGAVVPPHTHRHDEECLVVEGSIWHRGQQFFPGDYLFARVGEAHEAFTAPDGAMFLIRGEPIPDAETLSHLPLP